jgi:hypothetical protein
MISCITVSIIRRAFVSISHIEDAGLV